MSVTMTTKSLVIPIRKRLVNSRDQILESILRELKGSKGSNRPAQEKGNICEFAWRIISYATGDASGGTIDGSFDFSEFGNELHYVILDWKIYQNSGVDPFLYTNTDQWEALHVPGATDITILLLTAETNNNYGIAGRDEPAPKPIYLGKPTSDANGGVITFGFTTNTDTKYYNLLLQGVAFKEPLDLTKTSIANMF